MEALDTGMTAGEQRIFFIAMTCATDGLSGIKVDYELLAQRAGLKNASCASVLYGNARRKLLAATKEREGGAQGSATNGTDPTTPKTKANKVTKRTPKSSARGKGKAAKGAKVNDDISPTKIKGENGYDAGMPGIMEADAKVKLENGNGAHEDTKARVVDDFSGDMIEGTSYPRSELEWSFFEQSLWHVETYKSENEDGIMESIETDN
ncbi:hypothetical protein AJ79_02862 [Helicocarpus griseus UAMH5409]|uniref:Uncharacterized protein n=1 Tax=Helicocarpus griseus UAMH5409 TaxID=1447875 RepID=A0A2B7XZQ0_9EURO|nr:hypothetical protein AJ79_02862 [Helicocarpus griseus UAMH5409]